MVMLDSPLFIVMISWFCGLLIRFWDMVSSKSVNLFMAGVLYFFIISCFSAVLL